VDVVFGDGARARIFSGEKSFSFYQEKCRSFPVEIDAKVSVCVVIKCLMFLSVKLPH
jgi:hypothetical protein